MNKLSMEKLILEDVLKWAWQSGDPYNLVDTYKNTRNATHFNPSNTVPVEYEYEAEVFRFMREEFHPELVGLFVEDNQDYFRGVIGNICGQTAGYGAYFLAQVYKEWEIKVVRFNAENLMGVNVNHAVILAITENGNIVIDLDRKEVESIWWNTEKAGFSYPTLGKFKNFSNIKTYDFNNFISDIIPNHSNNLFSIDKNPKNLISNLNSLLNGRLNSLISAKP